ncbi:MAG: peptidase family protein [Thermoleophilia bacterium]|nr:peptidase family protein [Thermoleophilia bacterium]
MSSIESYAGRVATAAPVATATHVTRTAGTGAVAATAPARSPFGVLSERATSSSAGISAAQLARGRGRVEVWDMSSGIEQPVEAATLLQGSDPALSLAYEQALRVDEFMRGRLGRNGFDAAGAPLRIVVHAPNEDGTPNMNNAYWDNSTKRIYLGDGDGDLFAPLGNALDVLVHEATHAMVDAEVNLRYEGQQGGVNESWADVMGSLADPDDWTIGEDVFTPATPGDSIRDLEHPRFGHVTQLPKGAVIEPHDYSGIPSLAAVRVAKELGREEMGRIWYDALVDHLDSRAGYAGAARATLDAAAELHGTRSDAVTAVLSAWKSVGVDPRWKPTA